MRKYQKTAIFSIAIILSIFFLPILNKQEKLHFQEELSKPSHSIRKISYLSRPPPSPTSYSSNIAKPPPLYQDIQRELARFHNRDTRITIEKREVLSPREHRVLVTYTLPNGKRNSFLAIVNLKKQVLSRRWGRTIHENLGPPQKKLFPTGRLWP